MIELLYEGETYVNIITGASVKPLIIGMSTGFELSKKVQ